MFRRPGNEELVKAMKELEIYFPCEPNLKKLTSEFVSCYGLDFMDTKRVRNMSVNKRPVQKLKYLESITEDNLNFPFTEPILKSPQRPIYLKHINYAFYNYAFSLREMQMSIAYNYDAKLRPLIALSKNAPGLTFLELKHLYITPFDLEEIYAPNLTTLK